MKKLVSAATSLVMAATMVGAVAPVVAGAADAKKGLSLLAYKDATLQDGVTADGATVTVSADAIKAGDVIVPMGVYIKEDTADLVTVGYGGTVTSENTADAKKIKFKKYDPGVDSYFSSEKTFKTADGKEFSTDVVVTFAGSYAKRDGYVAHGFYKLEATDSQPAFGADNAYFGASWNNSASKYSWLGSTSDEYPFAVYDVVLPQGLAEGTYSIDFLADAMSVYGNPLCLLESSTKYDAQDRNNLDLSGLTIKVGDAAPITTTTSATTTSAGQTTTTATTATSGTTASTGSNVDTSDAEVILDLINPDDPDGYWRVDPDDGVVYVDMHITGKDATVKPTAVVVEFTVEGGFTVEFSKQSPALAKRPVTASNEYMTATVACPNDDGHGTEIGSNNTVFMMTFNVPDGIADGLYEISTKKVDVTRDEKAGLGRAYKTAVKTGYIAIGDVADVTTTAATSATTAATTTTTATSASATSASATSASATSASATTGSATSASTAANTGDPNYGDTNCDGSVKINDVVLLNKYLNDNKSYAITDQGKLNADCYNPKGGSELTPEDSDAIIKSIVHLVTLPVNK